MKYKPVVGLEIHLQVKTKTKMFSRARADYFNEAPNTFIDPVSFGLPGALPVPNKLAIEKAIKLALALNCEITEVVRFDRKNYFYPDLPKGYQISQFDNLIGRNGYVEIDIGDDSRRIRINRLHIEEDTAKSMHSGDNETLIDYNKSGVPLIEMVTEPDFESVEEVLAFAKRLRQIVRYTDTSDAEMQKGQMRFELNISIKEKGTKGLPNYKVEVKNIGSISVLEKVMNFEIERQAGLLDKGEEIKSQTRGLKDMTGETLFQRSKESSDDYRYFPEPDIPPIKIEKTIIEKLRNEIGELPNERKNRYIADNLSIEVAENYVEDIEKGNEYDRTMKLHDGKILDYSSHVVNMISIESGILDKEKKSFSESPLHPKDRHELIMGIYNKQIAPPSATMVIKEIISTKSEKKSGYVAEIIKEKDLAFIEDESEIDEFVKKVIKENEKVISDISKNPNALKFLVGQVMRLSKGRVNPNKAEEKLKESLGL